MTLEYYYRRNIVTEIKLLPVMGFEPGSVAYNASSSTHCATEALILAHESNCPNHNITTMNAPHNQSGVTRENLYTNSTYLPNLQHNFYRHIKSL